MLDLAKNFNLMTALKLEEVIRHLEDHRLNEAHVMLSGMKKDFLKLHHQDEAKLKGSTPPTR